MARWRQPGAQEMLQTFLLLNVVAFLSGLLPRPHNQWPPIAASTTQHGPPPTDWTAQEPPLSRRRPALTTSANTADDRLVASSHRGAAVVMLASNQVSNYRRRQRRTPADADGRYVPGHAYRGADSPHRELASGPIGRAACLPDLEPGCSGNPAPVGTVGVAHLLDEAPAQQVEVTEKGIDRVHRGASCLLSGGLIHRGGPVGPLLQGPAEDVGLVAQAGDGVAHGASLAERLGPSVSRAADSR